MAKRPRRAIHRRRHRSHFDAHRGDGCRSGDQVMVRALFAALVFVVATTTAGARQTAEATVASALSEARRLINADQPRAAIEKLRGLDSVSRPDVAQLLGVAYYHADEFT